MASWRRVRFFGSDSNIASVIVAASVVLFTRTRLLGCAALSIGTVTLTAISAAASSVGQALITLDRFPWETRADVRLNADITMAFLLVGVAITGISVVGFAAELSGGPAGDASGFTELSLLSEDENGTLVASDYPTEYRSGDANTLYVSVRNREGKEIEYTVIAKLQRIDETDESVLVREETELARVNRQIRTGQTFQFEHDVEPEMTGSNLRLVYLLYRGQPPENPTTDNAYRSVHLRINVTSP